MMKVKQLVVLLTMPQQVGKTNNILYNSYCNSYIMKFNHNCKNNLKS